MQHLALPFARQASSVSTRFEDSADAVLVVNHLGFGQPAEGGRS
jgi:hypothetical protein